MTTIATPDLVEVTTPPSTSVVTIEEFKEHLGEVPEDDIFLQSKINSATSYIEDLLKTWLREVSLKSIFYSFDSKVYMPGGRVDATTVAPNLVGIENRLVDHYLTIQKTDYICTLINIPSYTRDRTRLEVAYRIVPYATPEPIKEAVLKVASHLFHVRSVEGGEIDRTSLSTPTSMDFPMGEVSQLITPWSRKTGFRDIRIR